MKETSENIEQLTEHVDDWRTPELLIDHAERTVRNVALAGRKSRNGYEYTEVALEQAAPLYEAKPVFLDHAANTLRPTDRSTRDLAGSVVNPRYERGRIRGDIQLLDTEAGKTLLALTEANRPAVGMSHVVLACRGRDKTRVERIEDVVSVDAVVFPATTSTFREQTNGSPLLGSFETIIVEIDEVLPTHVSRWMDVSAVQVRRAGVLPDRVIVEVQKAERSEPQLFTLDWHFTEGRVALGNDLQPLDERQLTDAAWTAEANTRWTTSLADECAQLRRQVAQLETERDVERLLEESDLPEFAVTDLLRRQLAAAKSAEERNIILAERRELLKTLVVTPTSRERLQETRAAPTDAAIVATIRGRRAV